MSLDLVRKLARRQDSEASTLRLLDDYYTGNQPLSFLHPDVQAHVRDRVRNLAINWPRIIVGAIEERLDVEGFRLAADAATDDELWRIWQANDMDEWSQLGHVDAMVHGRSFVSVWTGDDPRTPRITFESAAQVQPSYRAGTRTLDAVLKVWRDDGVQHAVLYLPDRIERYAADAPQGVLASAALNYLEDGPAIANPLGTPPFVPFVNRPRLMDLNGESELSDVLPMADAVNKLATDMMLSSEFHAMPRRWITGMEIPREGGMKSRLSEEVKQEWTNAFPGKPWLGGKDTTFGQFSEASLENFISAIRMLTTQIAAIAGLPPHYLGVNTDNPASADAIRSAESSLIKKAERKQRSFGGSYERVMRLAVQVRDGRPGQGMESLETIWRDPATPTPAQKADAAVKLTNGERPIITIGQAREDLGYSPTQQKRMEEDDRRAADLAATADVRAKLALAQDLQTTQGLSQNAALAAVGLLAAAAQNSADSAA